MGNALGSGSGSGSSSALGCRPNQIRDPAQDPNRRGAFVAASNFSQELSSVHLVNDGAVAVQATASAWGMGCGWAAQLP